MKRRRLLIVVLGIGLLILVTTIGTSLESFLPHPPTSAVQIAKADPYQITLNITPNPPGTAKPATLSFQIVQTSTQQLVSKAHVALAISMLTMDMGTEALSAQEKSPGIYEAQAQFPMSGTWEVHISISKAGAKTVSASFDVAS
jgi:YtkA-like